jgi:Single-strand binding protein family
MPAKAITDKPTVNLSVLRGGCSAPPDVRELDSGRRVASLSVRVPTAGERATSVPVTVWEPPAWVETLATGDEIAVVGHVRRRFFRNAAGGTGARVEVEAETIARARDRRRLATLRRRLDGVLDAMEA